MKTQLNISDYELKTAIRTMTAWAVNYPFVYLYLNEAGGVQAYTHKPTAGLLLCTWKRKSGLTVNTALLDPAIVQLFRDALPKD